MTEGRYYKVDFPLGEGKTDYEKYLRTSELLSLQKTNDEAASPDELLFQVVHQSSELWMKLLLNELERAITFINNDDLWNATRSMHLVTDIQLLLIEGVDMIAQRISIKEYEHIRLALGQGSGMESPGFNRILEGLPKLRSTFDALIKRRGVPLLEIYEDYQKHSDLHTIAEKMMDFDDYFHKWRHHHYDLVSRTIGIDSNSLKNLSVEVLTKGMRYRFFQDLLDVRSELTNKSAVAYGGKPLEE